MHAYIVYYKQDKSPKCNAWASFKSGVVVRPWCDVTSVGNDGKQTDGRTDANKTRRKMKKKLRRGEVETECKKRRAEKEDKVSNQMKNLQFFYLFIFFRNVLAEKGYLKT